MDYSEDWDELMNIGKKMYNNDEKKKEIEKVIKKEHPEWFIKKEKK